MKALTCLAAASVLVLQGCAFAPGQHLDPDKFDDEGMVEKDNVRLVPITRDLLTSGLLQNSSSTAKQELISYKPESYRIGPNDLLYITVWDHPELTSPAGSQQQLDANGRLVRPDGTLFYPYIGQVQAAGRTLEELRAVIARRLTNYIDSPQVDVGVLRYGSQRVVMSGAFNQAGEIPVTASPMNLVQAVGQAGINTGEADLSTLVLKRDGREYRLNLDQLNTDAESWLNQVYLKDGDQIHLAYNDNKKVYVLGEVLRPQSMSFKTSNLNLMDALGSAGGLRQDTADGESIYVIRGAEDIAASPATVFQLDADDPTAFALAQHFPLQPQDVVFVGPANITRWNRFISQLLPSASAVATGAAIDNNL